MGPRAILNCMQGRQICAPEGNKTHSPLSSSNYLLFETLPRLCTREGVRLLPLNTSARSKAADESLNRHNSDTCLQFFRHKLELNLLSTGNSYRIGT